ncbi:MAG TPA: ROK family protein [Phycisphaerae bacterium]
MPVSSVLNILRTIKDRGIISRTDLQQETGLSWGTITNTTRELLNRKLIREVGAVSTKAGRKPMRLALNPSGHCLIGVEVVSPQGDKRAGSVFCLVINLAGEVLWDGREEISEAEKIPDQVAEIVQRAMSSSAMVTRSLMGIGVAVGRGLMNDSAFKGRMEARLREGEMPVRLESVPNALAIAERWFGAAGAAEDLLCIELAESLSMGVLIGGEIFRGSTGAAGSVGHVIVESEGELCICGRNGCLHMYCSHEALLTHAAAGGAPARSVEELAGLAAAGNAGGRRTFERMGKYLGIKISNLMSLFDPALVVLAGRSLAAEAHFMPELRAQLPAGGGVMGGAIPDSKVVISRLGERAGAMGACGIILQAAFDHGELERPGTVGE